MIAARHANESLSAWKCHPEPKVRDLLRWCRSDKHWQTLAFSPAEPIPPLRQAQGQNDTS